MLLARSWALVLSNCTLVVGGDPHLDVDAGLDEGAPDAAEVPPTKDAAPPALDANHCDAGGCNASKEACKKACSATAKTCNDACDDDKSCHTLCNQQQQACNMACLTACLQCVMGCGTCTL